MNMRGTRLLLGSVLLCGAFFAKAEETMSQEYMEGFVAAVTDVESYQPGYLQFLYKSVRMALISDATHDRMRIVAPIIAVEDVTAEQLHISLESNYQQALDARYASSNGLLFSAYVHPISPLTEDQLMSAIRQVATLAITFGEDYTSGELEFSPASGDEQKEESTPAKTKPKPKLDLTM